MSGLGRFFMEPLFMAEFPAQVGPILATVTIRSMSWDLRRLVYVFVAESEAFDGTDDNVPIYNATMRSEIQEDGATVVRFEGWDKYDPTWETTI